MSVLGALVPVCYIYYSCLHGCLCTCQGEGEDEDADDLVNQVLDEIGITTSSQVCSTHQLHPNKKT